MTRRFALWIRLVICLIAISLLPACASRYSTDALRALNPSAMFVRTCVRFPSFSQRSEVYAFNQSTQEVRSDENWDDFEDFARTAHIIYRYEASLPSRLSYPLPWPYQHMACRSLSSPDGPPVPRGLWAIPISRQTREALVATLTARTPESDTIARTESPAQGVDKRFLAQRAGVITRRPTLEQIEGVAQIMRDAIRGLAPTARGPNSDEISIIDTKTGQVIGGLGAGAFIGGVPGGTFISDGAMRQSPNTTREFIVAEKLGEVGSGLGQMLVGGSMALGGGGASVTGGGALVGVPVCIAGVGLATNGAITFVNGATSLLVAICHWEDLPAAPETASTGSSPMPTPAPAARPPPKAPPPPVAKPAQAPAAAKPPPKAAAPPPKAAAPMETRTTTRNKGTGVTNTKSSSGTTTMTRPKTAPNGQASTPTGHAGIRNVHLAGQKHPVTGVPFDAHGYPDFRAAGVVKKEAKIKFSGDRRKDTAAANKEAQYMQTPEDYTWHHHQDGTTMQLVPKNIHQATGHTGGFANSK